MGHFKMTRVLLILIVGIFFFVGCKKSELANANLPTVIENLQSRKDLSLFNLSVKMLSLDSILFVGAPFTVFAPTDSAFLTVGLDSAKIQLFNTDTLRYIIQNHIVNGAISVVSLPGFFQETFLSLNKTFNPYIAQNLEGTFFDGIPTLDLGVQCANGVVQRVGAIAFPPEVNIIELIHRQHDLNISATLLDSIIRFDTVLNLFKRPGTFTAFIPNDQAWKNIGYPTAQAVLKAQGDSAVIANYFGNYFLPARYFTSDLFQGFSGAGATPPPIQGLTGGLGVNQGATTIISAYTATPPVLVRTNILATNGVLHIVDQVYE